MAAEHSVLASRTVNLILRSVWSSRRVFVTDNPVIPEPMMAISVVPGKWEDWVLARG